jgi:hypothetical protein
VYDQKITHNYGKFAFGSLSPSEKTEKSEGQNWYNYQL